MWDDIWDDDVIDFYESPGDTLRWLRKNAPRDRTSTYGISVRNAVLGEQSEIMVTNLIRARLTEIKRPWTVTREADMPYAVDSRGLYTADRAIRNSNEGDLHIRDEVGDLRFSVEVKSSLKYPNVTITESELLNSNAKYLFCITTAGMWITTMEETRRVARRLDSMQGGTFYLVLHSAVKKVTMSELLG